MDTYGDKVGRIKWTTCRRLPPFSRRSSENTPPPRKYAPPTTLVFWRRREEVLRLCTEDAGWQMEPFVRERRFFLRLRSGRDTFFDSENTCMYTRGDSGGSDTPTLLFSGLFASTSPPPLLPAALRPREGGRCLICDAPLAEIQIVVDNTMPSHVFSVSAAMPREVTHSPHAAYRARGASLYRGTSLIRKQPPPGPYSRSMPRTQWWS
ncbi:hypothetical protein T484DRAFT_3480205 [Baffinella frigidus]|nr:hypothetical protein T484DRAFT_3480205 [Cryptophyta sp. CCMP2293]